MSSPSQSLVGAELRARIPLIDDANHLLDEVVSTTKIPVSPESRKHAWIIGLLAQSHQRLSAVRSLISAGFQVEWVHNCRWLFESFLIVDELCDPVRADTVIEVLASESAKHMEGILHRSGAIGQSPVWLIKYLADNSKGKKDHVIERVKRVASTPRRPPANSELLYDCYRMMSANCHPNAYALDAGMQVEADGITVNTAESFYPVELLAEMGIASPLFALQSLQVAQGAGMGLKTDYAPKIELQLARLKVTGDARRASA